jgi:oxepin-CoA hydrolase/3-oxo-5,6-dehydrosuberyl-CoA semialdehyde dehydrogenase
MVRERLESYLSGQWVAGNAEGSPLLNPSTEEVIAFADTSGVNVGAGLDYGRTRGGSALAELTFAERGEMLKSMSDALQGIREDLIDSSIRNGGCTRGDAKFDVDGAIGTLAAYAAVGRELGSTKILPDGEGIQLSRSPRFWGQHVYLPKAGVAVFINAFNFPAWGFAEKAACALLAGMPVLSKPATATAHTAHLLIRKLIDAQVLPDGALSLVSGAPQDLLDHLGPQDVLAFTGSAATALRLRQHASVLERNVPVNVEADSLNAAVLGPDVELGSDAMHLFVGDVSRDMAQKAGQKCTATRRIMVPESLVDPVVEAFSERLSEIVIGDPSHQGVRMGPLATARQLDDVGAGVKRLQEDAKVVFGDPEARPSALGAPEGKGFFFPIVMLQAASVEAPAVHGHEVFGPVATIVPYSGEASTAVEAVRRGAGGLVASIYSDDRKFVEEVTLGIAPFHGRLYLGSSKVRDHTMGPGTVLPSCTHGGPGRAGGGEELGGVRGVQHFMQRTALQGYRAIVDKIAGVSGK